MQLNAQTLADAHGVAPLAYRPDDHAIGIVHLGLGAFHRAHQAGYTHTALAIAGGDWRIAAVSLRSVEIADALSAQDGLYCLEECDAAGTRTSVIGSIARALALRDARTDIEALLTSQACRIITLTVTEKAYYYDAAQGSVDLEHPDIRHDLANRDQPATMPGLLVHALDQRRKAGRGGLSILSCDNLPDNGKVTRAVILSMARASDPALAEWISQAVTFPSSMVDRITPAVTPAFLDQIEARTGLRDEAAVQTETFAQWAIEDDFPYGRPAWEKAGALLVKEVAPYENMKLRMLNGSHSLLAYAGHVAGLPTVKACMGNETLRAVLERHLASAASTLKPLPGVDYQDYAAALVARFDNPSIVHQTYQIAMDGSQKMPQRIFAPTLDLLAEGTDCTTYAFATAAWLRYAMGRTEAGANYALRDPLEDAISHALRSCSTAQSVLSAVTGIAGLVPQALAESTAWRTQVEACLDAILGQGILGAAKQILDNQRPRA